MLSEAESTFESRGSPRSTLCFVLGSVLLSSQCDCKKRYLCANAILVLGHSSGVGLGWGCGAQCSDSRIRRVLDDFK